MMSKYWNDTEFVETVNNSRTIKEVLSHFGLPTRGGKYYKVFHVAVQILGIDISHFRIMKDGAYTKRPLKSILIKSDNYSSSSDLRKRLIKEGILTAICSICHLSPIWCDKPLTLQLDHINGDNTDNRIENLRLLCPNCHSQTETYCGNKKYKIRRTYVKVCKLCGGPKPPNQSNVCKHCDLERRRINLTRINWPDPLIVLAMVEESNFRAVGKKLGVSDNAVRKFLKRNNL
jgi:hypothetical protein